jgi:hypothetical protein
MLTSASDVIRMIQAGEWLLLAAQEDVLLSLPAGNWIGGTIPYFMTSQGGLTSRTDVFATPMPPGVISAGIQSYDSTTLARVCLDAPEHGVSFIILPANSTVHQEFAQNAPNYEHMYLKPLVGWISGVHLADVGTVAPKVIDGRTRSAYDDRAIVLHAVLDAKKVAHIGIVNLFQPGGGDNLVFPRDGFQAETVLINGVERVLAEYLVEQKIDTQLPLVADYCGAMINVSFQNIDVPSRSVRFFAPVVAGVRYQIAAPVPDYVAAFQQALPQGLNPCFSCNCILNYRYSELEGKTTAGMTGPFSFGEIAYQLLNQTMVHLSIVNV